MLLVFFGLSGICFAREGTITYEPDDGAGQGKHIVFVCGEWEYCCEESLPMLAKILSKRHGFKCTVLFSINPKDGTVDPSVKNNIPGMSVLQSADMIVVFAMDLELPDEQMKYFAGFLETGKPVFGIRCSLLSFRYNKNKKSLYAHFDFRNKDGGYATSLFGESWKGHYGRHGRESTRGLRAGINEKHPILRGVYDVWGPTDVYRITKLPADAEVLMYGQVLTGMNPDDPPNLKKSIMPMVWTRRIKRDSGRVSRVVMSTIGAAQDMESEDLRRLYVNSIFWAVGLETGIPEKADVSYVGEDWKASPFGGGKFKKGLKPEDFAVKAEIVQAGFFTPARAGKIWDTWIYYHDGKYYMYYLAGSGGHWDGHELATSEDGVHWTEYGVMIKPRAGVTWMGTGHIWKSPDFAGNHQWVMNYSEWFGDKQDIMFATSTDLLNWTKVDEKYRFVQDVRWYKAKGRWDCIDAIQRDDGSMYGYFTANPDGKKIAYRPCGFGFAESKDGISWEALPPIEGDIAGEFGGIQKLGDKYYILISEGRVAVGDKPEGPFLGQKKNHNVFGKGCNIYFPRFFHNAPGGPLVNHFYKDGTVFAAPLKDIEVDREGILRLKWWKNNDKLKAEPIEAKLIAAGAAYASSLRMLDKKLDLSRTNIIEGTVGELPLRAPDGGKYGIFFDHGNGQGQCLLLARDAVQFGKIKADGSNLKIQQTTSRDMEFGPTVTFRLVIKLDMMELYINDYLMNLKRVKCNGQVGFMGADDEGAFKNIKAWQSNPRLFRQGS
jgi:hypothetical protein